MNYENKIEELEYKINKCRQTSKDIKIKELNLIKQRDELKKRNKLNTTPWRIKSEELYKSSRNKINYKL